jgi:hypothetical protein
VLSTLYYQVSGLRRTVFHRRDPLGEFKDTNGVPYEGNQCPENEYIRGDNPVYKSWDTLLLRNLDEPGTNDGPPETNVKCDNIPESGTCDMECKLGYYPTDNIGAQWTCVFDYRLYS